MPGTRATRFALTAICMAVLSACGGGGGGGESGSASADTPPPSATTPGAPGTPGGPDAPVAQITKPQTKGDSARFLTHASFGPNAAEIDRVMASGYDGWLEDQFGKQQTLTHEQYFRNEHARLQAIPAPNTGSANDTHVYQSFWRNALAGEDQLGQRVAFALSQIFVVSFNDANVQNYPRGVASYLDMLRRNAFGNFRTLLEDVSLHPMMGLYLSHIKNQGQAGRVPDENYAREVMQLFTIGLHELNADGTPKVDGQGKPIETYDNEDVTGIAKIFTGWSWGGGGTSVASNRFTATPGGFDTENRDTLPMKSYPAFHSAGTAAFLGTTCPLGNAPASLKCGLDALFNHPNVGPFIGRQLIQRLVTSNPSPAYVSRVAAAFANNGAGVRGDMKAVVRAILLDPEARLVAATTDPRWPVAGKAREPILRVSAMLRAFDATSASGRFDIPNTDNPGSNEFGLGQTVMRSPSVFNFWRPGYVPPGSELAAAGKVAPELQGLSETSVVGYINTMQAAIANGFGNRQPAPQNNFRDVMMDFSDEAALADDTNYKAMVERINLLLLNGSMTNDTRRRIEDAVRTVPLPLLASSAAARENRARLAVFLAVASPEFIAHK